MPYVTVFLRELFATEIAHLTGTATVSMAGLFTASVDRLRATYTFTSFGNSTTTGTLFNPFQFTGRENEGLAGLYYYRARYYDPSIGRFLSEDPIRVWHGQANFYAYVGNSPTNYVDPFGLDSSTKPPDRNNPDYDPCDQLKETCPMGCDMNFTEGSTSWWICRTEDCPRELQLCRELNPPQRRPRPECAKVLEICPDCPMDPDVRSMQPGRCPRCGMTLTPGIPDGLEYRVAAAEDRPAIDGATDFTPRADGEIAHQLTMQAFDFATHAQSNHRQHDDW